MDRSPGRITTLSALGLLGVAAALVSIVLIGDTFGYPGSAAYRLYENFNRAMAIFIALQTCAIVGFGFRYRGALGRVGRFALLLAILAWIGMVLGTAAEFWLYSDQPYGRDNARAAAFSLFSISSLLGGLALLALGFELLRSRTLPRVYGAIMILYLPLDIALWFAGGSIFLAPALTALALAIMTLKGEWVRPLGNRDLLDQAVRPGCWADY